jgi:hypothetical protein
MHPLKPGNLLLVIPALFAACGLAAAQSVALNTENLNFGNQAIQTTSSSKSVTVQNTGTAGLQIASITSNAPFAETNNCPVPPASLAPGSRCRISVEFSPITIGNLTGSISIADNASGSPQSVSLTGTGVLPVALSPSSLSFSSQSIGTTSTSKTIRVTNGQSSALTINSIQAGGNFSDTSSCPLAPSTLWPGGQCNVYVRFSPTAAGTQTGQLLISYNATGSPQAAALTGTGVAVLQSITVSPSTAAIGVGNAQQFAASGSYNDGSQKDLTASATWTSTNTAVAAVSAGLAKGLAGGTASIQATLNNISGAGTLTVIAIASPVITGFTAGPATITAGSSTTLTASFTGETGTVNNGVGAVTSGMPATVTPAATTTYTLTVTNTAGTSVTTQVTVNVVPPPAITSFAAGSGTISAGNSTMLTASFTGGTGTVGNGVGAVTSGVPATVKPAASTAYTLTVTNAAGASLTAQAIVTVIPAPAITSFAARSGTITAGNSTTLTASFTGGTGAVDNGVSAVTSGVPATVTPAATTTYTLTVTNAAGASLTARAIVAVVPPPAITSFTVGSATITAGNSTTLTASFTGGTGTVDNGVSAVTSGLPVTVKPSATTTYTLTVTNAAGASLSAQTTVTVIPPLAITSFAAGLGTITAGNSTTLTASFTGGTGTVDNGAGAVTSGVSVTVTPPATTTYTLTVTNAAGTFLIAQTTVRVVPDINSPLLTPTVNPRYFTDSTGAAKFLTGAWIWNTSYSDYDFSDYMTWLGNEGMNFIRWYQQEENTPYPYLSTGSPDTLPVDLTQFNPAYFSRLHSLALQAQQSGLYMSVMLFNGWSVITTGCNGDGDYWATNPYMSGNNVNGINGDPNSTGCGLEIHTLDYPAITALEDAYVVHLVTSMNDLDNIIWEICNECATDSTTFQQHYINLIRSTEASLPNKHAVWFSVQWPNATNSILFSSNADAIAPNDTSGNYVGESNGPNAATPPPIVIPDTDHLASPCSVSADWVWRLFTRGMGGIVQIDTDLNPTPIPADSSSACGPANQAQGQALVYARKMNLIAMTPQGSLSSSGYALANPGQEYLIYIPSGGSVNVNLSGNSNTFSVEWLNTGSGAITSGGTASAGGRVALGAPFGGPAVLYLLKQ